MVGGWAAKKPLRRTILVGKQKSGMVWVQLRSLLGVGSWRVPELCPASVAGCVSVQPGEGQEVSPEDREQGTACRAFGSRAGC